MFLGFYKPKNLSFLKPTSSAVHQGKSKATNETLRTSRKMADACVILTEYTVCNFFCNK